MKQKLKLKVAINNIVSLVRYTRLENKACSISAASEIKQWAIEILFAGKFLLLHFIIKLTN